MLTMLFFLLALFALGMAVATVITRSVLWVALGLGSLALIAVLAYGDRLF